MIMRKQEVTLMNPQEKEQDQARKTETPRTKKTSYAAPKLKKLGKIQEMTAGPLGGNADGLAGGGFS
jgi:hypothetical protein